MSGCKASQPMYRPLTTRRSPMESANACIPCAPARDFQSAARFVRKIAGDSAVGFRFFSEIEDGRGFPIQWGTIDELWPRLEMKNDQRLAVCMAINGASNRGSKAED